MKSHIENIVEEWCIPAKAKAARPAELSNPWPLPPSLQPAWNNAERRKPQKICTKAQALKVNYLGEVQTHQDCYSFTSSDRDTNSISSGQQCFLPDLSGQPNSGSAPLQSFLPVTKPALQMLQTVKGHYDCAADYQID